MNSTIVVPIAAILAWALHMVIYVNYAIRFHPQLRKQKFITFHSLEASVVFGSLFLLATWLSDTIQFYDLLAGGAAILVLDIVSYILVRDFFRPLMSPLNALLPPICAGVTVLAAFFIFG